MDRQSGSPDTPISTGLVAIMELDVEKIQPVKRS
jgi:hypothetical protein